MKIEPYNSHLSIVLSGNFNPRIFTPDWFVRQELLDQSVIDVDKIEVIHADICRFQAEWCTVTVDKERFQVETHVAPLVRLSDLVVKLFGDSLPHTPITGFGINRGVHFKVGSDEIMNEVGIKLAPPEPWGQWGKSFAGDGGMRGGLLNLEMIQRNLPGDRQGHVKTSVQPSRVALPHGIYCRVNDFYKLNDDCDGLRAAQTLHATFEDSINASESIIDSIMALALREKK